MDISHRVFIPPAELILHNWGLLYQGVFFSVSSEPKWNSGNLFPKINLRPVYGPHYFRHFLYQSLLTLNLSGLEWHHVSQLCKIYKIWNMVTIAVSTHLLFKGCSFKVFVLNAKVSICSRVPRLHVLKAMIIMLIIISFY